MYTLPREHEKLLLHQTGFLAQKRLARGLRLNQTETVSLIASQLHERIRDGQHTVAELMQHGKTLLGRRHVLPSVPGLVHEIQVEGTFPDGVFLVTVHNPICTEDGDLEAALYGSFLPLPSQSTFPVIEEAEYAPNKQPGAMILKKDANEGRIVINKGRDRVKLKVTNNGDRPIQIGSHYHFIETNPSLSFDRGLSYGKRLDIPSGTAVRFEPGDSKTITLVAIAGRQLISGGNGLASGVFEITRTDHIVQTLLQKGFGHTPQPDALFLPANPDEGTEMEREKYISMYGPTKGDRIRLGDTSLWIEIEHDETENLGAYGEESKFGGGKTIREGMAQANGRSGKEDAQGNGVLDLVITNVVVVDWKGIYKADIGIKNGLIHGIGKSGNPDIQPSIHPSLIIGSSTDVISGEGLIITAGAIDAHVHYICPQQVEEALCSGTTSMIGGGTGPSEGTNATTCTPSTWALKGMFESMEGWAMNFGVTGKGNDAGLVGDDGKRRVGAMDEIVEAGACGLKLHEDWGSTPEAIRSCLEIGDKYDVQVNIHTDTLNESGFVESTIAAFEGRTIHTYHTEGAGGGHAPDIIVVCGLPNVLPSSTNPTRPYTNNTLDEHLDMLMVCHHLDRSIPEDLAFAESRIRAETVAAEDVLHDIGAISMISSDSQAMGRVGEVVSRTWRTASKMRDMRGPLKELGDEDGKDNGRVKRYVAKYTINPALTHGISHIVGHISVGTLADLVLWSPSHFGSKPRMIIKGGSIAYAIMGDANASIPSVQPSYIKPMWLAHPASSARAAPSNSVFFVSQASLDTGIYEGYGLRKKGVAVKGCRKVSKGDMKWNEKTPKMEVDPESYEVKADGVRMDVEPATTVPLAREYNLF